MTWRRTNELRFVLTDNLKILQQKWVEYAKYAVSDGPGSSRAEDHPTGKFEWKDIPIASEETDEPAE